MIVYLYQCMTAELTFHVVWHIQLGVYNAMTSRGQPYLRFCKRLSHDLGTTCVTLGD